MNRPSVSVVMPYAGDRRGAAAAIDALSAIQTGPGDELILSDNSGSAPAVEGVRVVKAPRERSPAHARNAGAQLAAGEWILFLDSDCRAPDDLLERYFAHPIDDRVGALAGGIMAAPGGETAAARYGARRNFLDQRLHHGHRYRPRAAAANMLVRRRAFEEVGGFYEGLRAGEDTDFSWRIQQAGWRLELRPEAGVEHRYRSTLSQLRTQWRGYAAGRAWLARRYPDFRPQPALRRALERASREGDREPRSEDPRYVLIDALLAGEELAGFLLSNRPPGPPGLRWHAARRQAPARVVLVADTFPARGDPLVELAETVSGVRVEAVSRPDSLDSQRARGLRIDYREDDGILARGAALLGLLARHPLRCARDLTRRRRGAPSLSAVAPAARRLERDAGAPVQALGGQDAQASAGRIAMLAGRPLSDPHPAGRAARRSRSP